MTVRHYLPAKVGTNLAYKRWPSAGTVLLRPLKPPSFRSLESSSVPYIMPTEVIQNSGYIYFQTTFVVSNNTSLSLLIHSLLSWLWLKLCMHDFTLPVALPSHRIIIDSLLLIIFGTKFPLWRSSECNYFHLLFFFHTDSNIILSILL